MLQSQRPEQCHLPNNLQTRTSSTKLEGVVGVSLSGDFPKVQLFSFSFPLISSSFGLFAHNYDPPKKKASECPKIEAQSKPESNITQIKKQLSSHFMINLFDGGFFLRVDSMRERVDASPIVLVVISIVLLSLFRFIKYPHSNRLAEGFLEMSHCSSMSDLLELSGS